MAGLLKSHYSDKHTKELHKSLPNGTIKYGEKYVKSKIIKLPNHRNTCFISGRFDIVAGFEDNTYGVIDFKTGSPNDEYKDLYGRQLHAYAYALENPAEDALNLSPISKLGLVYFHPERTKQDNIEQLLYEANVHWIEIEKDDNGFLKFLDEVLSILESPNLPEPSPDCDWCNYTDRLKRI